MSKPKKLWIQDEAAETSTTSATPIPAGAAGAWFRLAKVPDSGGCLCVERLDVGDTLEVSIPHQADMRAISLSKIQNFLLEELMR